MPHVLTPSFICVALLALLLANPAYAQSDEPPVVRTARDVASISADSHTVQVIASAGQLTLLLQALTDRASGIRVLKIHHGASVQMETRSLELLQRLTQLEALAITGDAFLYDDQFAAIGKLTSLRSLRLGLP